ncbi:unnamed protein product [Dibothriocephalus latus]|uniref:Uncharacterized protein n=1 Tax=Dibothriocephalus latus TaxID=60516 RepID=A0A3P7P2E4_DIBLA|nr:unnamed protein product [Dibothriocephalus latus]
MVGRFRSKNKRNYDVTTFYNSSDEEPYDELMKDLIKSKRKIKRLAKDKAPKPEKRERLTQKERAERVSNIIDLVLAETSVKNAVSPSSPAAVTAAGATSSSSQGGGTETPVVVKPALPPSGRSANQQSILSRMIDDIGSCVVTPPREVPESLYAQYKNAVVNITPLEASSSANLLKLTDSRPSDSFLKPIP